MGTNGLTIPVKVYFCNKNNLGHYFVSLTEKKSAVIGLDPLGKRSKRSLGLDSPAADRATAQLGFLVQQPLLLLLKVQCCGTNALRQKKVMMANWRHVLEEISFSPYVELKEEPNK